MAPQLSSPHSFCNHRSSGGDNVVGGRKKGNQGLWLCDRLSAAHPGDRTECGGEKAWNLKSHLGGQIWRPSRSVCHTLWNAGLWDDALLGLGVSPFNSINLHPNLPPPLNAMINWLPEWWVFCRVGWGMGVEELWLTCLCFGPLLSLTDFSLFLFSYLSTQAMQVKVQVKCMTCLFCPSIRGARLWPPSVLWSPWGWSRMDFPTWRSPRPAPGKTTACQRVNVGLPTLGMGKPGKPAKPRPIRGLLAISAPFPAAQSAASTLTEIGMLSRAPKAQEPHSSSCC